MPEVTLRHEFDCDEDTFWEKVIFSEEFNRRLYLDILKFPGFKLLEQRDEGDKRFRRVHLDPPLGNVPAPVRKVVGDKLSYVEEGTYDKHTRRYEFNVTPSTMADKTRNTGVISTEKIGEKKIVRVARVDVQVKVFMIGGMVEEMILGDLKKSYEATATFTREYLREKGY